MKSPLFSLFFLYPITCLKFPSFYPLRIHYPIEDTQVLLKRIENRQITEIRISPDLKNIISVPNPMPPSADPSFSEEYDDTNFRNTNIDVNQNGDTYHSTNINSYLLPKIIDTSIENSVKTTFLQEPIFINPFFTHLIQNPFGIIYQNAFPIILVYFILQRFRQRNNNKSTFFGFDFEMENPKFQELNTTNIRLSDWAGSPEIFYECYEIISYLQNATLFEKVGAEIPRGILLEGPPGTGKTLLARAIASEVNASFISVVGSQFVEMYVGVGAMRIRELFQNARENRPCILFIDEIDAIGKQRNPGGGAGNGGFSGNDEREQTLNQLLAEMDGFQDNQGILVMAATNLKDTLDKALLRPGRFDRILTVSLPDTPSREKILHKYLDSKPVEKSHLSIQELAEFTEGFSGAELKNLVNEALIHMIRRINLENTDQSMAILKKEDVNQALEKILVGIVKQNDTRNMEVQKRVALHELGHAIMIATYSNDFDLQKISVQNTYSGIGGFTLFKPKKKWTEGGLYTKDFLEKRLQIMLGGRAAEEVFYGSDFISLGATRDLEEANHLAKQMVEQYGMGSNKTNVYFRTDTRDNSGFFSHISENMKSKLENESYDLVSYAYQKTVEQIRNHKNKLEKISMVLLMERVLYGNPFY